MPYHNACITDHVRKHFTCPQCKAKIDMTSIVKGPPSRKARREEISPKRISVAEVRRMPQIQPTRRIDLAERGARKRFNPVPLLVGIVLLLSLVGGGYFAVTRLPSLLKDIEKGNPLPTLLPTQSPPQTKPGETLPQTLPPGQETYFSWFSNYLTEWNQGRTFQYSQEIYYSTRTVKSDIKWKMAAIVNLGNEKAMLFEVSMTTEIPGTESKSLESSGRKWVGVESKKCIKVETSTGGKRKEGSCSQSLFGAGVDFEAIPSWESIAKVVGQEEVNVPAGIFSATKVEINTTIDNTPALVTLWYVSGKPPVKIEVYRDGKLYMLYVLVSS